MSMCQNVSSGHYVSSLLPMNSSIFHGHVCLFTIQKKNRNENERLPFFVDFNIVNGILVKWILVTEILSWATLVSL